jgi:quercetin dioxygenase-like cupin family protein
MLTRRLFGGCAICAAVGLVATKVNAQAPAAPLPGVTRTILSKTEFPGDKYITLLASAEIAPGTKVPWHTHPGVETAYILDGEAELSVRGQPDRTIKATDGFQIPFETPHSVRNGDRPLKIAVTYVVEKDKPLVTLVPE